MTELPGLSETLVVPEVSTLELDELWSFVLKKASKRWIWIALCRQTRQVVAFVMGDGSEGTCRRLWHAIPEAFRRAHCYTDFRKADGNVPLRMKIENLCLNEVKEHRHWRRIVY